MSTKDPDIPMDTSDSLTSSTDILEKWIGKSKNYKNVPLAVSAELLRRLALSDEESALLPDKNLNIPQLINVSIPSVEPFLSYSKGSAPASCFTSRSPTLTLSDIAGQRVPHLDLLNALRDAAGQAMLDGHISIRDWRDKSSTHCLPFNAITFWRRLHKAAEAQEKWSLALHWLKRQVIPADIITRVEEAISRTPWKGEIRSLGELGLSLTHLSKFLSEEMLDDGHIDAMLQRVRVRLQAESGNQQPNFHIEGTAFAQALTDIASNIKQYPKGASRTDLKATKTLTNSESYSIYGVAHSAPLHWVGYVMEKSRTHIKISWGDSLAHTRTIPKRFKKGIQKWASFHFKGSQVEYDESLPCSVQRDAYSCGIISVNTLKHTLFHDPLWAPAQRELLRVMEFLDILEYHLNHMAYKLKRGKLVPLPEESSSHTDSDIDKYAGSDVDYVPSDVARSKFPLPPHSSPPNVSINNKRPICLQETDSEDEKAPVQKKARQPVKLKKETPSNTTKKPARSGDRKKRLNQEVDAGTFVWQPDQLATYKEKLSSLDAHYFIDESDAKAARTVRHSTCNSDVVMSTVYDITRFKEHLKNCKSKIEKAKAKGKDDPARNTRSLIHMFALKPTPMSTSMVRTGAKALIPVEGSKAPCPGLSAKKDPRIEYYLEHAQVQSAGGRSEIKIAQEMFSSSYSSLSDRQKRAVTLQQHQTHRWSLDHIIGRIYAIGEQPCLKTVWHGNPELEPPVCVNCTALLSLQAFQNAISRKRSEAEEANFIPHRNRNSDVKQIFLRSQGLQALFDESSEDHIFRRFVHQYAHGLFEQNDAFLGLLQVMVSKTDRESCGKGLQNMYYPPSFDTLAHEMLCISPAAYRTFKHEFGGRSERSFAAKRALAPPFTHGHGPHTAARAKQYLIDYGYPLDGPLGCAVDDTKLLASIRPVYNNVMKCWFLVGGAGEPVRVDSDDIGQIQNLLSDLRKNEATKLRLWTLVIPLPGIPPLVLSVEAIGSKNKGPDLGNREKDMLDLVVKDADLNVTALASDGASVERDGRRFLIRSGYAQLLSHSIPHPEAGYPPIVVETIKVGRRRMAVVQDSKHLRKTFRNNLFSGAKALVLGRYFICYQDVREAAYHADSPVYIRDVDRLDRQDDRATARMNSAEMLEHLVRTTDNHGLIVYLYVTGDLIDAYQSRTMSHRQRVKVVLRAKFFKDIWKAFLRDAGYSTTRHFLSPEADDITDILINGFMGLVYIYRDDLKGQFPLLPWTKSSEANEHAFGSLRQMTADFTFADVLSLIPKLGVRLMAACKRKIPSVDFRRTASGYMHTYTDGTNANLHFLRMLPSDAEINLEAHTAWDEAISLWDILGYSTVDTVPYPFPPANFDTQPAEDEPEVEDENNGLESIELEVSEHQELQDALQEGIEYQSSGMSISDKTDSALDQCSFSAAALRVADLESIEKLPDSNLEKLGEIRSALSNVLAALSAQGPEAAQLVQQLLQSVTPDPDSDDEDTPPVDEEAWTSASLAVSQIDALDLTPIVEARKRTQSKECAQSVRIRSAPQLEAGDTTNERLRTKPRTDRQILAAKIHEIIRRDREQGTSTGLNRLVRHTTDTQLTTAVQRVTEPTTGNVANARLVSTNSAATVVCHRRNIFSGLLLNDALADAKITSLTPLKVGRYGVVIVNKELLIAKVLTLYERSNGKTARHNHVESSASIGAVSYIPAQLWQFHRMQRFRSVFGKTGRMNLPLYGHVPAASFLYLLPDSSIRVIGDGPTAQLDLEKTMFDDVWSKLSARKEQLHIGIEKLTESLKKKASHAVDEDEE
ncbi:hypothetical protein D9619_006031 [Psilocybe cf. subviscida]|uniref:Ubiquitin-like protease family profile domain-containing protein n=1 Tax=Psilocybe cf. subviscida TaxID=2480587 RepID=A0A8H5BZ05_9AGAR|nr:hypothetical protein D9619_006031 [Psilocybe cf. subviscida]